MHNREEQHDVIAQYKDIHDYTDSLTIHKWNTMWYTWLRETVDATLHNNTISRDTSDAAPRSWKNVTPELEEEERRKAKHVKQRVNVVANVLLRMIDDVENVVEHSVESSVVRITCFVSQGFVIIVVFLNTQGFYISRHRVSVFCYIENVQLAVVWSSALSTITKLSGA